MEKTKQIHHIVIETPRLIVFPLTYHQLLKYVEPGNSLEKELDLALYPRTIPTELLEALQESIIPSAAKATSDFLYFTLWTMVLQETNVIVGDLCFKGPPNEKGEIEIGYGTYPDFEGKGYMTEAVAAMVNWAFSQTGVNTVLAGTIPANIPSQRILEKNQFKCVKVSDKMIWWKIEKKP